MRLVMKDVLTVCTFYRWGEKNEMYSTVKTTTAKFELAQSDILAVQLSVRKTDDNCPLSFCFQRQLSSQTALCIFYLFIFLD